MEAADCVALAVVVCLICWMAYTVYDWVRFANRDWPGPDDE